ncbi:hypothetical protein [Mycolicibacterium fortuitum]|uniref:Uncharacterized protein n=1 Tax=Mycolicibacterium fortuitum TaxID=1766 RepID=A0AAE5AFG5_MYCFO|nr:hypothetical protein [Mycolicibacterium fortuitum]MDV7194785.1 hypothetical protein [Mycolicibacterium fortuitum]MDV7207688.1 hypothetical protein [Mycolicibacterium fortuitum]MDV7229744.1 hypothetical protein [Mycolicibacterium fortuitum]MDV7261503.1 hypothetical protein [Mycolicibacterium fortuitum]MDV7286717.1 hypothetical protein [Mycolicibacterium fortuitum]
MTANDDASDIDWDEVFKAGPGAVWVLPDMELIPAEPEIPMPAEIEETAAVYDAQIESVFSMLGIPIGTGIVASATRAVWAQISAAVMAHRRDYIAASGAHTELDYYRQETDTMPTFPARPRTVAVIARTQDRAAEIADILGIDRPWVFGAKDGHTFEGLRAARVLIDADSATTIDPRFLQTAHATALKTGGRVHFVTVRDFR